MLFWKRWKRKEKEQGHIVQKFWSEDNWRLLQLIIQDSNAYFESTNIDYLNKYIFKEYTVNYKLSELGAEKLIENAEKIIIYGAGIYGTSLKKYGFNLVISIDRIWKEMLDKVYFND